MTECRSTIDSVRECRPITRRQLWLWVQRFTGVRLATNRVCKDHTAPFDLFARQFFERPSLALWCGPRGSGKSFNSAIDTHLTSRFNPRHETRILGGSKAQSEQIYQALTDVVRDGHGLLGSDRASISRLLSQSAKYRNGSSVSILSASLTSVLGPHPSCLKLDEVDEIDPDIRERAMGMPMEKHGYRSSVLMTSTWHRVGGPMSELMERGRSGAFPVDTYCVFEVLERCPPERSGPNLEKCPQCPIMRWCHEDRDTHPSGLPKAKRSRGHYTIDTLIQKTAAVSDRVFASDYLCLGPKAAGVWFTMFDEKVHVRESAEFDPARTVHLTIDPGVHCGGVAFQIRPKARGRGHDVNVFSDYFAEGVGAEANARAIRRRCESRCGPGMHRIRISMDPSGDARTVSGPTVRGEFELAGLRGRNGLETWGQGKKADGLSLIEALLMSADGTVSLTIHPRCKELIAAFKTYRRAKRANQWMDYAEDPQHPAEDLIDPLCGGLKLEFPEGRTPPPRLRSVSAAGLT